MKTAIVTGANGFVGNAIVKELVKKDIRVVAIVHSHDRNDINCEDVYYIECNLNNYEFILDTLSNYNPDTFYHFAWEGTSGAKRSDERIQLSNVQGACDAVRLASLIGCQRFIFASSIMEYEVEAIIKKMHSPEISSIYSSAKIAADYMSRIIAANLHIEYISALISNIYGPGEKTPRLINSSIRKLLAGESLSLSSCEQLYDFIYITDAARMIVAIGEKGVAKRTYYIGNQHIYPLKKYMEDLRDVVAPEAELGFGDLPFNGVSLTYNEFDKGLVFKDTGVLPEVPFKEGIRLTRNWIEEEDSCGKFCI